MSVSKCQVIMWYILKLQTIISNSLKSAHSAWSVFQVMSLHIEASYSLNIQAMMFQRCCQTPLFSQNTRMLCLRIVYTAYHAMGNKQERIIQHSRKLVRLVPKQFLCDQILGLKSTVLRSAKFDLMSRHNKTLFYITQRSHELIVILKS